VHVERLWSSLGIYVLTGNENGGRRLDNGDLDVVVARFGHESFISTNSGTLAR